MEKPLRARDFTTRRRMPRMFIMEQSAISATIEIHLGKMKSLFENLFGKKPRTAPKHAERPGATPLQLPAFEPFKKGDLIGGKYYVHRLLGMGGFGMVLCVSERGSDELCALKTFRDEFLPNASAREAFKREATLWINLEQHPFVLAARWIEIFSGRLFVMMDYVAPDAEGRVSLADHLHSGKPIAPECALEWAIQFCKGMEHAIAHGIRCHRDIKPSNVLIGKDGNAKIADFGLAAVQHKLSERERLAAELCEQAGIDLIVERSKEKERLFVSRGEDGAFGFSVVQQQGNVLSGTPGYIAPEVYRGGTPDVRSDVYTFGLVLWQMATGSAVPPFVEVSTDNIERFMQAAYRKQISEKLPALAHPLDKVIRRCLNPNPGGRYSNFEDLRTDVEGIGGRERTKAPEKLESRKASATSWSNRGASFCELGKLEEAIVCFDRALAIEPRYGHAWSNKGVVLYSLGRNDEALRCFENALNIDCRDTMAWCNAANVLSTLGRHEKAIECCDKALALDPHDPTTWNNQGNAHHALHRYEEAIACYEKAIATDRRDARAWSNKGGSLRALGRHLEAIEAYANALAINPHSASALYSKAESEYALNRWREAKASYQAFAELNAPDFAHLLRHVRDRLTELHSKSP
jgi:serine/threonine protein kinase